MTQVPALAPSVSVGVSLFHQSPEKQIKDYPGMRMQITLISSSYRKQKTLFPLLSCKETIGYKTSWTRQSRESHTLSGATVQEWRASLPVSSAGRTKRRVRHTGDPFPRTTSPVSMARMLIAV